MVQLPTHRPGRPRGVNVLSIRDASYLKTQRLMQIKRKIASQFPQLVNVELLIIWIQVNIGLTAEKARDYIETIVKANDWVIEDGSVKPEKVNRP